MQLITVKRRQGWSILYNRRALCGYYNSKREAAEDARRLKQTIASDAQLKEDLDRWAQGE